MYGIALLASGPTRLVWHGVRRHTSMVAVNRLRHWKPFWWTALPPAVSFPPPPWAIVHRALILPGGGLLVPMVATGCALHRTTTTLSAKPHLVQDRSGHGSSVLLAATSTLNAAGLWENHGIFSPQPLLPISVHETRNHLQFCRSAVVLYDLQSPTSPTT